MQCPSCQFENIPGAAACGRCGATMQLAAAEIDVHPPRATARAKRMRRWVPLHAFLTRASNGVHSVTGALAPEFAWNRPEAGVLLRMTVPGWPQRYLGRVARGRVFFWFYVVLVLMGVLSLGTSGSAFAFGLAISVHISSILDMFWAGTPDWPSRLTMSVATMVIVGVTMYLPAYWAASQVVGVRRINLDAHPLQAGDSILFRRGNGRVGDVVVYRIRNTRFNTQLTNTGEPVIYEMRGEYIDRIIAGPGQTVTWKDQQLYVDGRSSPWQPLNPAGIPTDLEFSVPEECYGILPSTQPPEAPVLLPQFWQRASIVSQYNIEGTVWLRRQPTGLWGRL